MYNLKFSIRCHFLLGQSMSIGRWGLSLSWALLLLLVLTEVVLGFFCFNIVLYLLLIYSGSKTSWTPISIQLLRGWYQLLEFIWTTYPVGYLNFADLQFIERWLYLKLIYIPRDIKFTILCSFRTKIEDILRLGWIRNRIGESIDSCLFNTLLNAIVQVMMVFITVVASSGSSAANIPHLSYLVYRLAISVTIWSGSILTVFIWLQL